LAGGEPGVETALGRPECAWISRDVEQKAMGHAVTTVVPQHLAEVRGGKLALIAKTEAAVKERLTKEITHWDHRAELLKLQEQAGKPNARLISGGARKRADLLQGRLERRLQDLKLEAQISPAAARGAGWAVGGARWTAGSDGGTDCCITDRPRRHPGQCRKGTHRCHRCRTQPRL
jgi:hypothetical protein